MRSAEVKVLFLDAECAGFTPDGMRMLRSLSGENIELARDMVRLARPEPPKLDVAALASLIPVAPPGHRLSAGRLDLVKGKLRTSRKERFGIDPSTDADDRRRLRNARKAERRTS